MIIIWGKNEVRFRAGLIQGSSGGTRGEGGWIQNNLNGKLLITQLYTQLYIILKYIQKLIILKYTQLYIILKC